MPDASRIAFEILTAARIMSLCRAAKTFQVLIIQSILHVIIKTHFETNYFQVMDVVSESETRLYTRLKTSNVLDFLEFAVAMELTGLEQNCVQV